MHKRIKSFGYAFRGIKTVFATEANMKIHLVIAILVVICGFFFRISVTEWLLCLLCFGLVLSLEMINTAIEKTIDLVSPEYHSLAEKAKDAAAGAVLISAIIAAIVGLIIFIPKGWNFLLGILN
jgi:diacylglycerol kinase